MRRVRVAVDRVLRRGQGMRNNGTNNAVNADDEVVFPEFESLKASEGNLSIGHMAALNLVSKKQLQHYQKKGLLSPSAVNEDTGYRYYTFEQSFRLDRILRYQSMGFTLEEIAFILDNEDSPTLIPVFERQIKKLDDELARLSVAKEAALAHLEQHTLKNQPGPVNEIRMEWLPEKAYLRFDVPEHALPLTDYYDKNDALAWYYVLRLVKRDMVAQNIPLELFGNVCDLISMEDLSTRNLAVSSACIFVDGGCGLHLEGLHHIPAGFYLTCYHSGLRFEDGSAAEPVLLKNMLDYLDAHGLKIRGPYFSQGDINRHIGTEGIDDVLLRMFIPVTMEG